MPLSQEIRPQPTVATAAFGRVFYGAADRLYFSQVFIDDLNTLGRCFQRNDPTAEVANDILATDGGEILLQESGEIVALVPFQLGILLFCQKGVWYLSGGDSGFTATQYKLDKVVSDRIIGPSAYVVLGSDVLFGAKDSLYRVSVNEFGNPLVSSLTDESIKDFWVNFITPDSQFVYDEQQKKVLFVRCSCPQGRMLVLDVRTGGFYPWKISLPADKLIQGAVYSEDQRAVIFFAKDPTYTGGTLKVSTLVFDMSTPVFKDFSTETYDAYIETVPQVLGNYSRNKGVPLIKVFMRKTEENITEVQGTDFIYDKPSACSLSLRWDWSTSGNPRKDSGARSIYNPVPRWYLPSVIPTPFDTGDSIVLYKDKIRGSGKSIQFKFQAQDGKAMELLGFSVQFSAKGRM